MYESVVSEPVLPDKGDLDKRILIVDDDHDFIEGLDLLLTPIGFDIVTAHSTEEAVQVLNRNQSQIALIDIRLAGENGISLIGTLKEQDPDLVCLMMTAYSSTDTAIQAIKKGAYDYLLKPFNFDELLATLERSFEKRNLEQLKDTAEEALKLRNTELESVLEELAESEQRFRSLVESSPVCIQEITLTGEIQSINPAGLEMLGYEQEDEVVGEHYRSFVDSTEIGVVESMFHDAVLGATHNFEFSFVKGAVNRVLSACFAPLKDMDGKVRKVNAVLQDITQRKTAEEELHQAQKMEAIGQLTGGVAHDFNNQLSIISGNAELLSQMLVENPDSRRFTDSIVQAATRGAELTHRLLAFSRKQPLRTQVLSVSTLIEDMKEMLDRTLEENIEIEINFNSDTWFVSADPNQLENAILNLAINSRDAMKDGGRLEIFGENVTLEPSSKEGVNLSAGDYVVIGVKDTGTGITAALLPHVFEPFYTSKMIGEGSGLGLSMVYGFAKQSGGHVQIESTEGVGTTIRLYLPRTNEKGKDGADLQRQASDIPEAKGETILVIEDNDAVRELTVSLLESLGYRTLTAIDGITAISVFKDNENIDLILSDLVLPGDMNGFQIVKSIKSQNPDVPALFMSGYVNDAFSDSDLAEDGADLISKPFNLNDLARKISQLIRRG